MHNINKGWYIYVLLLEDNFYYIGITLYPDKRIHEHFLGCGANFTKKHKPIKVVEMYCLQSIDRGECYKFETQKTKEYRSNYGHHKVIGGKYLQLKKASPH